MKDYLQVANDPWMWIMAVPVVVLTGIQGIIFAKKAFHVSEVKVVNLTREQCIKAFRVGAVSAVGPAVSVFIVMLGMMAVIGGPMSWLRLSIIGAAPTELTAATIGAKAMGIEFGSSEYGIKAYASSVWTMTLNGCGWLLFCGLFTHKLGAIKDKVAKGDTRLMGEICGAAILGTSGYLLTGHLLAGGARLWAGVAAAISMVILEIVSDKVPKLKEYNLGLAMIVGMIVAAVI
ncbi:DUF5058 family protein [Tissierella sp.]|uniref:DUF5058 family protein n=1 Tax=Tissierella sp. TaxID=41274 RepID=UPI0028AC2A4A|nr:DUF5058 family protein [Tissierella sp.]